LLPNNGAYFTDLSHGVK